MAECFFFIIQKELLKLLLIQLRYSVLDKNTCGGKVNKLRIVLYSVWLCVGECGALKFTLFNELKLEMGVVLCTPRWLRLSAVRWKFKIMTCGGMGGEKSSISKKKKTKSFF